MSEEKNTEAAEKVTAEFRDRTIAADLKANVALLNTWLGQLKTEARGTALQARISQAVDGKAGERTKKLNADLEKIRLSIAEIESMIAEFEGPKP